ncbi:MAG: hypothetical protein ACXQTP_02055 [Candidatus Methanofastidiosia archaeon]
MKDLKLILIGVILSMSGIGFLYFEAERAEPQKPEGNLSSYVENYICIEGVVCRKFESKGNVFIAIKGDYEVEIPLFFGLKEKLDIVPELGDWVYAQGILEEVPQRYMRQFWPIYSLQIEKPDHLQVEKLDLKKVRKTDKYTLSQAGCLYPFGGQVTEVCFPNITVDSIELLTYTDVGICDEVSCALLIVEDEGVLKNIPFEFNVSPATYTAIKNAKEEGNPYMVRGKVLTVKKYYQGLLMSVKEDEDEMLLYLKFDRDIFCRDEIEARGIYKEFYNNLVLYVSSPRDISLKKCRREDDIKNIKDKTIVVLKATIKDISFVGKHPIYTLDTSSGTVNAHLYASVKEGLLKRGKDPTKIKEGEEMLFCLLIRQIAPHIDAEILDFV